jgi:TPR repeat protein
MWVFCVIRDLSAALKWYGVAAELGQKEAKYRLENLSTQEL